jgi:hypothetical protein
MSCNTNCAYKENKVINILETAKSVYVRLDKDICHYIFELGKLQEYFQSFDLENDNMFEAMVKKYNHLSEYLYVTLVNHLSISLRVNGLGEKIIKPVTSTSHSTTLKYQNICKRCSCDDCSTSSQASDKYYGCGNSLRVQYSKTVATYDNMSISKNYDGTSVVGYTVKIGELEYVFKNGNTISIKSSDCITDKVINDLFKLIDAEITNLGDIQRSIRGNIDFIDKYIKKF